MVETVVTDTRTNRVEVKNQQAQLKVEPQAPDMDNFGAYILFGASWSSTGTVVGLRLGLIREF